MKHTLTALRLDSPRPLRYPRQRGQRPHSTVDSDGLRRLPALSSVPRQARPCLAAPSHRQHRERAVPDHHLGDSPPRSSLCFLHWNHWRPRHFRRLHGRPDPPPRGRLQHQGYGKARRSDRCRLLATLLHPVRSEHKPGSAGQRHGMGLRRGDYSRRLLHQGDRRVSGCPAQRPGLARVVFYWRAHELQGSCRTYCFG